MMTSQSSIKRLKLCSLTRLRSMLESLDLEIDRLGLRIEEKERESRDLSSDEGNVALQEYHGEYLLKLDRIEYDVENLHRKVEDLNDKKRVVQEVYFIKELEQGQVTVLGSVRKVKIKDGIIFLLILLVLGLLAVEAYRMGATGGGARASVVLREGRVVSAKVLDGGQGYSAMDISLPLSKKGKQALLSPVLHEGELKAIEVLFPGEGYDSHAEVRVSPAFTNETLWAFWGLDTFCCVIFLANFFFEMRLSSSNKWYWKRHWIDFMTSIPIPPAHLLMVGGGSLSIIRAGRVLRLIRILRALRILRMFLFFWRGLDQLSTMMDVKLLKRSLVYGLCAMFCGGVLFMSMERVDGGEGSFLESLWWSFTTLITGGFADIHNPVTIGGKILTVMLVIGGMVLVGVFTATLTSVLVKDDEAWQRHDMDEQFARLERLEGSMREIKGKLDEMGSNSRASRGPKE